MLFRAHAIHVGSTECRTDQEQGRRPFDSPTFGAEHRSIYRVMSQGLYTPTDGIGERPEWAVERVFHSF